jgi:hypothetical protein
VTARREVGRVASLDRTTACRCQVQRTEISLEKRDGEMWLSIAVGGQLLSARIEPGLAIRLGTDLLDLGFSLAPDFRAKGH